MDFSRTGIEFGPWELFGFTVNPTLHFYGLLIVGGILATAVVAAWMARRDGKDPDHIWNGLLWAVAFGVIGARIWFVLFPPQATVDAGRDTAWMLENFFDLNDGPLAIWNGGLGIFGAFLGGALGIYIYSRRAKINPIEWMDIVVVAFPLGHAIGRWGNYVNQELYGLPTSLPWAITIDNPPPEYANESGFHPLFLYESLWNLLLFGVLLYIWLNYRDRLRRGDFILFYLIGYPTMRFLLEFLRIETAHVPVIGINSSQLTSAIGVIFAVGLLIYRYRIQEQKPKTHPDGRPIGKPKKATTTGKK